MNLSWIFRRTSQTPSEDLPLSCRLDPVAERTIAEAKWVPQKPITAHWCFVLPLDCDGQALPALVLGKYGTLIAPSWVPYGSGFFGGMKKDLERSRVAAGGASRQLKPQGAIMRDTGRHTSNELLYRLVLMVATEPSGARRQQRVTEDVALLREAISLYVGMRQPQGRTAERVKKVCQIYDLSPADFMNALSAMVAAPGRDPAGAGDLDCAPGVGAGKVVGPALAVDAPFGTASGSRPASPPGRKPWARAWGYGGLVTLSLLLALSAWGRGSWNASAVTNHASLEQAKPAAPVARSVASTAARKTGKHWIKLALMNHGSDRIPLGASKASASGLLKTDSVDLATAGPVHSIENLADGADAGPR